MSSGDISSGELIARLQQLDPDGNRTVEFECDEDHEDGSVQVPVSTVYVDNNSVVLS